MIKTIQTHKLFAITLSTAMILSLIGTSIVGANHAWGKYHWDLSTAETEANPLKLGNNLTTTEWNSSLIGASSDWNWSVLKNKIIAGASDASCSPTSGQVEVCNDTYGENGWLGIAQIWATRGKSAHITQGAVLLNDTYFNRPAYDTAAWRDMVTCQEIGHTFGLGHQDENFTNTNLGTCMDYTNDPDGTLSDGQDNLHPNAHDYAILESIYGHLNSTDSGSGGGNNGNGNSEKPKKVGVDSRIDLNDPSSWGQAIKQDALGNNSVYEKVLSNGMIVVTHVTWIN